MTNTIDMNGSETPEQLMHDIITPLVTSKMNAELLTEHLIPLLIALKNSQSNLLPKDEKILDALIRAPETICNNIATVQKKYRRLSAILFEENNTLIVPIKSLNDITSIDFSLKALNIQKILVVEDEIIHQDIAASLLSSSYQLDCAKNGVEAINKCKQQSYDLILMDLQMPIMNGVVATEELRKFIAKDTIIVGLTSMPLGEKQISLLDIGFNDFLEKPLKLNDFQHLLKKLQG